MKRRLTLGHIMLIELVPFQGGLELGAEEAIAVARVAEDEEVEGKDGDVDECWPQDEAQSTCQEVPHHHPLTTHREHLSEVTTPTIT